MRFRSRLTYEHGLKALHIAPFVSIAFLLLLLFLFSTKFCSLSGIRMDAPSVVSIPGGDGVLEILIADDSACYVNGSQVTEPQMKALLAELSSRDPGVLIKASRKAPLDAALNLWRLCEQSGMHRINLITDKP
jgi:biopolymer transport protein ExbD